MFRDIHLEQKGPSNLKKMSIPSLSYPILRGCINTRGLMKNPMLSHERLKRFRQISFGIITSHCLNKDMELCLNFNTKDTKMKKKNSK